MAQSPQRFAVSVHVYGWDKQVSGHCKTTPYKQQTRQNELEI